MCDVTLLPVQFHQRATRPPRYAVARWPRKGTRTGYPPEQNPC